MQQVKNLFNLDADLLALSRHAESVNIAQKLWLAAAPSQIGLHSRAGSLKNGELTVYADNGTVATKIKLMNTSLLMQLDKINQLATFSRGTKVTVIIVKVQAKSSLIKRPKPQRKLSKNASSSLNLLAQNLTDSPLRDALNRLAKRV